ncbi:MAG: NifB/NifX family molybdenum-iron cluster-binding protein [Candidatus Aminicenantales bacterium]
MTMKKAGHIFLALIILGGWICLNGQEQQPVKIAVASEGEAVDSQVTNQGPRCSWFLLFDENGGLKEAIENPYREARGGAGVGCADLLAGKGVTVFVAGQVGGKMAAALENHGIAFVSFSGSVKDAVAHVLEKIPGAELQAEAVALLSELVSVSTG